MHHTCAEVVLIDQNDSMTILCEPTFFRRPFLRTSIDKVECILTFFSYVLVSLVICGIAGEILFVKHAGKCEICSVITVCMHAIICVAGHLYHSK